MATTASFDSLRVPPMGEYGRTTALNAQDRCDRCGAQPHVAVVVSNRELLFCSHHFTQHAPSLADQGAWISLDQRAALTVRS